MLSHAHHRIGVVPLITFLVISSASSPAPGKPRPPPSAHRCCSSPGPYLKVGDRVVDTGGAHHLYTVERAEGGWLWLISGASGGWASAADVIPLERALGLYSDAIKRDPNAAWAYFNRASSGTIGGTSIGPSPITRGPSNSAPVSLGAGQTGAMPGSPNRTSLGRSPTTPRPSGSTRRPHRRT